MTFHDKVGCLPRKINELLPNRKRIKTSMLLKRKIPSRLRKYLSGDDVKALASKNGIGERAVQKILKGEVGDGHGISNQALKLISKNKEAMTEKAKRFEQQLATL